jgi:hypothetical protein
MADNTTLNIGIGGDVIATEDPGLGYKLPVSKIRLGATDIDGGDVTITNPFPTSITDGYNGTVTIKPGYTIPMAGDSALVVTISPNSNQPLPVNVFTDEFGNYQFPNVRFINGLWTLHTFDDINQEYFERSTLALEALLDIEDGRRQPPVIATPPIATDLGMVVRQAGSPPTESDISGTGSLNSAGQTVVVPLNGVSTLTVNILGTWVGTITFSYSVDGITYFAAANPGFIGLSTAGAAIISTAANGTFTFTVGAYKFFKIAFSAYTSGQAIVNYNCSIGTYVMVAEQTVAANLLATVTQGGAAAVANSWFAKISDGVNGPAAVKASGVTPLTTDAALTVTISPNTKAVSIGAIDITNTIASLSAITIAGATRLQVNDDPLRILLEQMMLVLIDIRSILAATNLKGEAVSLSNIDTNNGN